jgi:amino acid adenylation domain-containing protein
VTTDAKQRLSSLSEHQKRLLAQRLSQRRPAGGAGIPRTAAGPGPFPLSFAQQRFWFLTQLSPASAAFNCSEIHRLRGPLDVVLLERSLNEVVRRHDVLRTRFEIVDGVPRQHVDPVVHIVLPLTDLSGLAPDDREQRRWADLVEESRRPWTLDTGPVVRARLWRFASDDHLLLVSMHHIVADGWSQGLLIDELASIYASLTEGRAPSLPELPIQYADFAVWQREWAEGPEFERQLEHWKRALDRPPVLQLPAIGPATAGSRGTHKRFCLAPDLTEGLRALCQAEGVTLFMALLSALALLLSRYTGQEDLVVGAPIANRDRPEVERLIGCFMNPLPIRTDLSGDPTFRDLLRRVREASLGAFANQHVPFDVLVRNLRSVRDGSTTPLFQVMFLLQNIGLRSLRLGDRGLAAPALTTLDGLRVPEDREMPGDLMYPVAFEVIEVGSMLAANVEYADEFAATFSGFPGHLRTLLGAAIADPACRISALPILTAAERSAQLVTWNHERLDRPPACAHELFETEAAAHPESIAIVSGDTRLSYHALDSHAEGLARALGAAGVGAESRVGILLDRSAAMVTAAIGVMKSGAAYVPLDPAYPVERLRFIARDSALRALVTRPSVLAALPDLADELRGRGCAILDVDEIGPASRDRTVPRVAPGQLAYVIYTSGTTGQPKGTMVSHASLANAYLAWEHAYGLRELGAHLQMASLSFDVCTGDLVRALCSGAKLVIVPQELLFSPDRLQALIVRERVDAAEFVPVVLRDLVKHLEATGQSFGTLRLLVAGSDSWFNHEYERLRALCGAATRVVNSYGLTEATIDSTFFDGADAELPADGLVPLGRAFPNTEIVLLDRQLQLVPVGVAAELCVAGLGLARGYLGRPDLTAERFVPHPFATVPGARLYRTGDLARYLPDGTIELLGRIDNQVKLRGFRIELAEVESAVAAHPSVSEAVAVVREDRPGDRRLVAYVVPVGGEVPSAAEIRRFLRDRVPDYMVPSTVATLAAFPVTPNGKIDRTALPAPEAERQSDEAFVAPRTETERRLATIWRDVLQVNDVGVHDNFFDLGGHSLLVVQLHSRMRDAFERELSVVDLFRYPTVESQVRELLQPRDGAERAGVVDARDRAAKQRDALKRRRQAIPADAAVGQ